jgi:hypothetical protein
MLLWGESSSKAIDLTVLLSDQLEEFDTLDKGRTLAKQYCASCHLFPEPEHLDRKTWEDYTLHKMRIRLGMEPQEVERHPQAELLKATGVIPETPMISEEDWKWIERYYLENAPEKPMPQEPREEIAIGLKDFQMERPRFRRDPPLTTLVKISEDGRRIYVGDAGSQTIDILDAGGAFLQTLEIGNIPVSLSETERGLYVTSIGYFYPSEDPRGSLILLEKSDHGFKPPRVILKDLPRPVHATFADLNGNGKEDFTLAMFGNIVGRFSWFESLGEDQYEEHVLIDKPGAVQAVVHDFNGNGHPDIAVLIAQETEAFYIFTNDGKGNFTPEPVFQRHSLFGHTYFELADFNGNGLMDLLVTNGDNGEYPSPTKNYHGIRIYTNQGDNQFEETFFFPMNGAFKAMARDFDGDGDLDIAAISFFPDYVDSPRESFVYLENQGNLKFKPSTFRECISGRWLVMDVGDLGGNGKLDIVLGSLIQGPSEVPSFLKETWERSSPSALILKQK